MNIKAFEKNNSTILYFQEEQIQYGVLFVNDRFIKSGSMVMPDETYEEVLLEDFTGPMAKIVDNSKRYFESYKSRNHSDG